MGILQLKSYLKDAHIVSACGFVFIKSYLDVLHGDVYSTALFIHDTVGSDYSPFSGIIKFRGDYSVGDTECVVVYVTAPDDNLVEKTEVFYAEAFADHGNVAVDDSEILFYIIDNDCK